MSTKKSRKNVRKKEIPTNTPTEFALGDIAVDTEEGGERTEGEEGGRETTEGGEGESQEDGNSTVTDRGGSGRKKTKNREK